MAKKDFKSGMDLLLQGSKNHIEAEKKAEKGMNRPHTTKATYFFNADTLQAIKAIAYYDRTTIGEVINQALKTYAQAYEDLDTAMEHYAERHNKK